MTTGPDPFLLRTPLSRELLERYAAGRLDPDEQHAVELHLEQDPLLREAAEGLRMPGATDALAGLRRPKAGHWGARLLGLAIIAGTIAWLVAVLRTPEPRQQEVRALLSGGVVPEAQVRLPYGAALSEAIAVALELPGVQTARIAAVDPDGWNRLLVRTAACAPGDRVPAEARLRLALLEALREAGIIVAAPRSGGDGAEPGQERPSPA